MKLYEALQAGGFHTAVMTTFGVDFDAFESIALARLRGAECRNVMLIGDAGMVGLALADLNRPPRFAGTGYLLSKARAPGVFHPKVIVQLGKEKGRLIVSSANATAAGLAGNLEIAAMVECDGTQSSERGIVLAGWHFVLRFLDMRHNTVQDKLRWAHDRTPWLNEPHASEPVVLSDGTQAAFVASSNPVSIARRFIDLVNARHVDRLIVISPYWDDQLSALDELRSALRPHKTHLLLDTERRLFPTQALSDQNGVEVSNLYDFDKKLFSAGNHRFVHAKMIVATAENMDHVLLGSANCTFAALGNLLQTGANEEACIYRQFPADKLLQELGILPLLRTSVDIKTLPTPIKQDPLPLADASENDSGAFELIFDRLVWWPSSVAFTEAVANKRYEVELLDSTGRPLSATASLQIGSAAQEFRLSDVTSRPAFARFLKPDGSRTNPSVITCVEELRLQTRDPLTARAARAIQELSSDDDEGVWLLEIINTLALPKSAPATEMPRIRGKNGAAQEGPNLTEPLGYEEFMRGRRREFGKADGQRNSLAGQHVSYVRAALNRLIGVADADPEDTLDKDNEKTARAALDTGDEVGDRQDVLERGFDPTNLDQRPKMATSASRLNRRQDVGAIVSAVRDITEQIRCAGELDTVDMLRLRAMLMILGVSARPSSGHSQQLGSMQVLPCSDARHGDTWPRLIGRVLACLFGGPDPALKRLRFDRNVDRIPDDILETLACCIWFSQAIAAAAKSDPGCARLVSHLVKLAENIKQMLPLSEDEKASPAFAEVIERLDQRFAARLALGHLKPSCMAHPLPQIRTSAPIALA